MLQISVDQLFNLALRVHQSGRLAEAEKAYRQILAQHPDHAPCWHQLGVLAGQVGQAQAAVELLERACNISPADAAYRQNLGLALQAAGRIQDAILAYQQAIRLAPGLAEAHYNLGHALSTLGKFDPAILAYRQALHCRGDYANAYHNLGTALEATRQFAPAADAYRHVLRLRGDSAETLCHLGNALRAQGLIDQAIVSYSQALRCDANFAQAHSNLGICLQSRGQLPQALACFRQVVRLKPELALSHYNLGQALHAQGGSHWDQAIACFRHALVIDADYADAYNNLGVALKDAGQLDASLICHRQACRLEPQNDAFHSNLIFTAQYHPASTPQSALHESQLWNQRHAQPLTQSILPHANDRAPDRLLRIGYVSPDFRAHCQAHFMLPLLANHDPKRFQVFCYADLAHPDAVSRRLQSHAANWRIITGMPDETLAELIRADGIDILVDLSMHMAFNRLRTFARRPAPVQVTWLAYPGTTGLHAIDYRLTDPYLDPPGTHDPDYAEASIRLPECFWCYDPLAAGPPVSPLPAQATGRVTFGCLNNFCKINDNVLALWAIVLRTVNDSCLLMLAPEGSPRSRILDIFSQERIAADRIQFVSMMPRADYLQLYQRIDIGLDTLPYNGHTTSLDSFWMGVPVITQVGQTVVGRAGLSLLMNLDLPELIATTSEQFAQIAAALARDLPRLSTLRSTLRQRMQRSPLMDAPRFASNVQDAFRQMWYHWCAGLAGRSGQIPSPSPWPNASTPAARFSQGNA